MTLQHIPKELQYSIPFAMHIEADLRYKNICSVWPGLRVHFPAGEHEEHNLRLVCGAVNTHVPYTSRRLIALDFDGTCVTHAYPVIGDRVPGFVEVLEAVKEAVPAAVLVLNTVRCGLHLIEALDWLARIADRIPPLAAANLNPDQSGWNNSTKIYAPLYIDDAALGAPLMPLWDNALGDRPCLDWRTAKLHLELHLGVRLDVKWDPYSLERWKVSDATNLFER